MRFVDWNPGHDVEVRDVMQCVALGRSPAVTEIGGHRCEILKDMDPFHWACRFQSRQPYQLGRHILALGTQSISSGSGDFLVKVT